MTAKPDAASRLYFEINPARLRLIRFSPLGHMDVKSSDRLPGSCVLDVGVWMLGIDPNPDICLFAGTKKNVRPSVHSRVRTEEGCWETPVFTRP
jgi:hypothetical protein